MQDIRKPYTRSKSNREESLSSKVEEFETQSYPEESSSRVAPVHIPIKRIRRNIDEMDMYPKHRKEENEDEHSEHDHQDIIYTRNLNGKGRNHKNNFGTWMFIFIILIVSIGVGLFTYVFNSATITITPKYSDIDDLRKTVVFSKDKVDTNSVPFIIASSSVNKSKTLPLSESKTVQTKASGKIVIYNNFDSNTQKLIKNTRFESSEGKIYRINQSIVVPPKVGDTPGSIEVMVYADSYGSDYNVNSTNFTIVGFKGTPRYQGFYAKSSGAITGGASGKISVASLSDINSVKDELAIELKQQIKEKLSEVKKDGYIGLYSAIEITYEDNEKSVLSGNSAVYEVKANGYLMLADSKQLATVLAKEVRDYDNSPVSLGYENTLVFTKKDSDHISGTSSLSILVEGKPRIIWLNDEKLIKNIVTGKKRDEFKTLMKSISSIETAEISFSPLWLSYFPNEIEKISIVQSLPKR